MAKIVVETDTETGIINCTVNGKAVEGVQDCNFYSTSNYNYDNGESLPCVRFYASLKPKKEDGVTFYQSVQASKNPEYKKALESGKASHIADDVILVKDNTVISNDLAKCFMLK